MGSKMEPCGAPQGERCRGKQKVITPILINVVSKRQTTFY